MWKDTLKGKHVARVACDTITTPKPEGSLGVRKEEVWNRTYAL